MVRVFPRVPQITTQLGESAFPAQRGFATGQPSRVCQSCTGRLIHHFPGDLVAQSQQGSCVKHAPLLSP